MHLCQLRTLCAFAFASFGFASGALAYTENFDDGAAQNWSVISGSSWAVNSASYYHNKGSPTDAVGLALYDATWTSNFVFSARLRSDLTSTVGTIRKIGLVFNYVDSGNYYTVLFAPDQTSGNVELLQTVGGTTTTVATGTFAGAAGTWFTAVVTRLKASTSVAVNGVTVINSAANQTLGAGKVGVTDRTNFSRFDDITVSVPAVEVRGLGVAIANGDSTPATTDDTDFGSLDITTGATTHTFTILNTGEAALSLDTFTSTNAEFAISAPGATTVAPAGSTTFTVTFNPSATGTRKATLRFNNSDPAAGQSPFKFTVQGVGTTSASGDPAINVKGAGVTISDGDTSPSTTDGTDFGSAAIGGGVVTKSFTIENSGTVALPISSLAFIPTGDFSQSGTLPSSVAAGSSATFSVKFVPAATGLRTTTLVLNNGAPAHAPYQFNVQGTGTGSGAPEIEVDGDAGYFDGTNYVIIATGDTTPSTHDHTDFGSADIRDEGEVRTYTIRNTGTGPLTVGSISISGTNAGDFTVIAQPDSSVEGRRKTTFSVLFKPTATGTRTATVTFTNSDSNEGTYTFAIQGTGTASADYAQDFSGTAAEWTVVAGTSWAPASGSYLHNKGNPTDALGRAIATSGSWATDYVYSLRMKSQLQSTGVTFRKVGAVYNYVDASNFYEVLFTPDTGAAELRQTIAGTQSTLATGTFTGAGQDIWFDVTIIRYGTRTTIKANDTVVFDDIGGQTLGAGRIGVVDQVNNTRFDDVVVRLSPFKRRFPRIGGMNISGRPGTGEKNYNDSAYQQDLAKLDLAIIGFYDGWNYTGSGRTAGQAQAQVVANIKAMNPNLVLGNYTIMPNISDSSAYASVRAALSNGVGPGGNPNSPVNNDWWARTSNGDQTTFESSATFVTNITSHVTPAPNGDRFPQWMAKSRKAAFFDAVPDYDLWYSDNAFYRPRVDADWNRDGTDDSKDDPAVRVDYRNGMVAYWSKIAELRPDIIVMGNVDGKDSFGGLREPEYQRVLGSAFLEAGMGQSFSEEKPGGLGWYSLKQTYHSMMDNTVAPHLVTMGIYGDVTKSPGYAQFRYGLCTVLMENGYFNYTHTPNSYWGVQWFDEYDLAGTSNTGWLGEAIDPPQRSPWSNGVFRRRFTNGVALVNPRTNLDGTLRAAATVDLTGLGYRRISGTQDSAVNNGANVTTLTLAPGDGIVLRRQ